MPKDDEHSVSTAGNLDPALFGPPPARDERFTEKRRWIECANFPNDHPLRIIEFFHRQMNEELNGVENAAQSLADFPDTDWKVRMSIARQCADEARHVEMFRRIFESRGGKLGEYPILNFQYRIIANEFISETIRKDPRAALRVAKALTLASTAFLEVMGREAIEKVAYLTDEKGRLEAGFGLAEVKAATTQAIKRRASYESH